MAYNMLCKNCGRKESTHEVTDDDDNPSRRLPGRKFSLNNCPDFKLSQRDIKNLKTIIKKEEVEKIAEGNYYHEQKKVSDAVMKNLGRYFK